MLRCGTNWLEWKEALWGKKRKAKVINEELCVLTTLVHIVKEGHGSYETNKSWKNEQLIWLVFPIHGPMTWAFYKFNRSEGLRQVCQWGRLLCDFYDKETQQFTIFW